ERAADRPGSAEHLRRAEQRRRGLQCGSPERFRSRPRRGGSGGEQVTTIADPRDILLAPVISEKSYGLIEEGTYTFIVHPDSNKTQIKIAVEKVFGVKVTSVNTANRQGKRKRTRFGYGKRKNTKRALVTISADSKPIEIFGGPVA